MAGKTSWDLSKFQVEDVFRMAVAVEQGGIDLYDRIIEASDKAQIRNELKYLREEEVRHKDFFLRQLPGGTNAEQAPLGSELGELLEAEFLVPMEELYSGGKIRNSSQALRFGVLLEQRTVELYTALRQQRHDPEFQKNLDLVIAEERRHKEKLNLLLAY